MVDIRYNYEIEVYCVSTYTTNALHCQGIRLWCIHSHFRAKNHNRPFPATTNRLRLAMPRSYHLSPEGRETLRLSIRKNRPWERSTGPRTDAGKKRCSQNALKHSRRSRRAIKKRAYFTAAFCYCDGIMAIQVDSQWRRGCAAADKAEQHGIDAGEMRQLPLYPIHCAKNEMAEKGAERAIQGVRRMADLAEDTHERQHWTNIAKHLEGEMRRVGRLDNK